MASSKFTKLIHQLRFFGLSTGKDAAVGQAPEPSKTSSARPSATASMNCLWTSSMTDCSSACSSSVIFLSGEPTSLNFPLLMTMPSTPIFLSRPFDVGRFHDDADAARQRAGIRDDAVRRGGDIVAAGSGDRSHRGDHRLVVLIPHPLHRIVDLLRRNDTAARTIDPQDDGLDGRDSHRTASTRRPSTAHRESRPRPESVPPDPPVERSRSGNKMFTEATGRDSDPRQQEESCGTSDRLVVCSEVSSRHVVSAHQRARQSVTAGAR